MRALALLFTGAALVLAPIGLANAAASQNLIEVSVSGVRSAQGHVRVDVCSEKEFLKDCRYGGSAPAQPGVTTVVVSGLAPGVYAVQAYHDRNDNHEVDRNLLGLPKEGVGFSNTRIGLHAPSFQSAAFSYEGGVKKVEVHLQHFAG